MDATFHNNLYSIKPMNFELLLLAPKLCCYFPHKEEGENIRPQKSYSQV